MIKKIALVMALIFICFNNLVLAEKTSSISGSISEKQVKDLKTKIATKVAELTKKESKVVAGFLDKKDGNTYIIKNIDDDKDYKIEVDKELTSFKKVSGTKIIEIKEDDIKSGDYLIVDGVNLGSEINANNIYLDTHYSVMSGSIVGVDISNKQLEIETSDKEKIKVDVSSSTKSYILDIDTLDEKRTSLSKVKAGDLINFVYETSLTNKNKDNIYLYRYLVIPQEFFEK